MSSIPILLPISTRSIGFTIYALIRRIQALLEDEKSDFDWYRLTNALYRVSLLRLHIKINNYFKNSLVNRGKSDEPYFPLYELVHSITYFGVDFAIIHQLLSAIGYMKYGRDSIVRFFAAFKIESTLRSY